MPTTRNIEPVAPGVKRTPSESVAFGRRQWQRKWRTFAAQWSQPQLMKLASATLGEAALHSSQIHGFTTGKLRDPAPKVLLAIGQLNMAIAEMNGFTGPLQEDQPSCPGTLDDLWLGKNHMVDADGHPLGPLECFAAFSGMIDLGLDIRSGTLSEESMPVVSKAVGKYLRFSLMDQGIDVMDIPADKSVISRLIWGKEVAAFELEGALEQIAEKAGVSADEVWDTCLMPALAANN